MMFDWSGRTIGGYEIAERIGRGGAAVVYRAYQSQLERWVAVKILQGRIQILEEHQQAIL